MKLKNEKIMNLLHEYAPIDDMMTEEEDITLKIREAVNQLPLDDRLLFLMVVDAGSQAEVARYLKVSNFSLHKEYTRIKKTILEKIK